ncbi:MAG: LuxR C-terminal-related transcriptional regulator [Desulfoferrobacter sp.]
MKENGDIEKRFSRLQAQDGQREASETRCIDAKREWERTFDAIDDFVTILDPNLLIIRMNRAIAEFFHINRGVTNNVHCYELFWGKQEPCRQCPASLVLKDRLTHRAEFNNRVLDKTFLVSASPILNDAEDLIGMVYVTRDITDRKRAENALWDAYDKLEMRVAERTSELTQANTRLQEEIAERKRTETLLIRQTEELNAKSRTLEEVNIALRMMLRAREEDKKDLEDKVVSNVKELVFPYLNKVKNSRLTLDQAALLDIISANLDDVISPFSRRLSSKYLNLTPREIQIADLIKGGHTNKDIAEILRVSLRTIEFHRENIRKKLGINKRKTNLRSYLLSLQ